LIKVCNNCKRKLGKSGGIMSKFRNNGFVVLCKACDASLDVKGKSDLAFSLKKSFSDTKLVNSKVADLVKGGKKIFLGGGGL